MNTSQEPEPAPVLVSCAQGDFTLLFCPESLKEFFYRNNVINTRLVVNSKYVHVTFHSAELQSASKSQTQIHIFRIGSVSFTQPQKIRFCCRSVICRLFETFTDQQHRSPHTGAASPVSLRLQAAVLTRQSLPAWRP